MEQCNVAITPANPRLERSKEDNEKEFDLTQYRILFWSLRYLYNTRLDLTWSVEIVSWFREKQKMSHLAVVKRILGYIKGSIDYGILFPTLDKGISYKLLGYNDSNYFGDKDDRKTIEGCIFLYVEAPISWCSKKEPVVALSSCEAKYIATILCACQAVWLMNLIHELSNERCVMVTLKIDNMTTINLVKHHIAHMRSKHIEMMFHCLRKQVSEGKLKSKHCKREDQERCNNWSIQEIEETNEFISISKL